MSAADSPFIDRLRADLAALDAQSLLKKERPLLSPQGAIVRAGAGDGQRLINMCANDYLGLANHPMVREAAHAGLDRHGFGMASVRFICGTHTAHTALEARLSRFLGMEDAVLFSSCFDANAGVFEALLGDEDAIVSDALNHASIIDGIRLSKARRHRYANNDMGALGRALDEAGDARTVLIVTDGVFSMDGTVANLPAICALAEARGALVMVDDSHAVGFVGDGGRGTPALLGVEGRIDILTGTMGKALGGASGGYLAARSEVAGWIRQSARPYLFSNALMPAICEASLAAIDLAEGSPQLRAQLVERTRQWREGLSGLGFAITGDEHPIVPVMTGDAKVASAVADLLFERRVLVAPFSFPVVPRGQARVRTQVSAAHTASDIEDALRAFDEAGRLVGLLH